MKYLKKDTIKRNLLNRREITSNGCWIFTGTLDSHGYGRVMIHGIIHSAARVSLHIFKDFDLKSPLDACHNDELCNSRACINPDHLYPGTRANNIQDSVIKGTHKSGFLKSNKTKEKQNNDSTRNRS
jgi:hypothetical protein